MLRVVSGTGRPKETGAENSDIRRSVAWASGTRMMIVAPLSRRPGIPWRPWPTGSPRHPSKSLPTTHGVCSRRAFWFRGRDVRRGGRRGGSQGWRSRVAGGGCGQKDLEARLAGKRVRVGVRGDGQFGCHRHRWSGMGRREYSVRARSSRSLAGDGRSQAGACSEDRDGGHARTATAAQPGSVWWPRGGVCLGTRAAGASPRGRRREVLTSVAERLQHVLPEPPPRVLGSGTAGAHEAGVRG